MQRPHGSEKNQIEFPRANLYAPPKVGQTSGGAYFYAKEWRNQAWMFSSRGIRNAPPKNIFSAGGEKNGLITADPDNPRSVIRFLLCRFYFIPSYQAKRFRWPRKVRLFVTGIPGLTGTIAGCGLMDLRAGFRVRIWANASEGGWRDIVKVTSSPISAMRSRPFPVNRVRGGGEDMRQDLRHHCFRKDEGLSAAAVPGNGRFVCQDG